MDTCDRAVLLLPRGNRVEVTEVEAVYERAESGMHARLAKRPSEYNEVVLTGKNRLNLGLTRLWCPNRVLFLDVCVG